MVLSETNFLLSQWLPTFIFSLDLVPDMRCARILPKKNQNISYDTVIEAMIRSLKEEGLVDEYYFWLSSQIRNNRSECFLTEL